MRLFHFSDDSNIEVFVPRPVRVAAQRPPGLEWLNGPLVWAIDEAHQGMYLFPRDCPRILLWSTPETTQEDYQHWWQGSDKKMLAYVEEGWLERIQGATLYRYEFPIEAFEDLEDAGMWVSRKAVKPIKFGKLTDLLNAQEVCNVELRVLDDLSPLKGVWDTSLHASGIRLRNAQNWH